MYRQTLSNYVTLVICGVGGERLGHHPVRDRRGRPLFIRVKKEDYPLMSCNHLYDIMVEKLAQNGCPEGRYILRNANNKFEAVLDVDLDEFDLLAGID